jgi:tRNA (guanine-N7-)-methyltransferase
MMTDDPAFDIAHARRVHGRRRGKPLRPRPRALVEGLLPRLEIGAQRLAPGTDPRSVFSAPVEDVWLEIGFGKGEHLLWQAERHPDVGFIGVEPFIDGVASLLTGIEEKGLTNIRIFRDDARYLMTHLADASIGRCFLLFPDPWPKLRHHKRRFVNPANLAEMARCMKSGAELRIGTDHADYGRWILAHMLRQDDFVWAVTKPADCLTRPDDWPGTRYEAKGAREGRPSIYLSYRRR